MTAITDRIAAEHGVMNDMDAAECNRLPGGVEVTTYYKAIRPDGTSFYDPDFRWVPESGLIEGVVVTHPAPHDANPSGWLSVATVRADLEADGWQWVVADGHTDHRCPGCAA